MTTTHITKEGLLQDDVVDAALAAFGGGTPIGCTFHLPHRMLLHDAKKCMRAALARAAELSAQESKSADRWLDAQFLLIEDPNDADSPQTPLTMGMATPGKVLLHRSAQESKPDYLEELRYHKAALADRNKQIEGLLNENIELRIELKRLLAAPSVSAQDASPKDVRPEPTCGVCGKLEGLHTRNRCPPGDSR